jgi:hypothetical protein
MEDSGVLYIVGFIKWWKDFITKLKDTLVSNHKLSIQYQYFLNSVKPIKAILKTVYRYKTKALCQQLSNIFSEHIF